MGGNDEPRATRESSGMVGGLILTAIWLPAAFAVITVTAYLVGNDGSIPRDYAAAIGLAGALLLWVVAAFALRSFASVAIANGTSFDLVQQRLERLRARTATRAEVAQPLEVPQAMAVESNVAAMIGAITTEVAERFMDAVERGDLRTTTTPVEARRSVDQKAVSTARRQLDAIETLIGGGPDVPSARLPKSQLDRSPRWVLGTGYIDLWRRIHLAEEAMILAADAEPIAEAAEALERLTDSGITTAASLSYRLRVAAGAVDPSATSYLKSIEAAKTGPSDDEIKAEVAELRKSADAATSRGLEVIKEIRHTVNSYRDTKWEGLVHARNRLAKSAILAGAMAGAILALAVILHAPPAAVVAGVVFYLVGGLVGVFARLRTDAEASTAVDDYGLSTVTLIHTPLVSGLAAVAGVAVTSFLASDAVTALLVPPIENAAATVRAVPLLTEIFSISSPVGLLVAAIFGASPGLLTSRLQDQAKRFKDDIAKTERATSGAAT